MQINPETFVLAREGALGKHRWLQLMTIRRNAYGEPRQVIFHFRRAAIAGWMRDGVDVRSDRDWPSMGPKQIYDWLLQTEDESRREPTEQELLWLRKDGAL